MIGELLKLSREISYAVKYEVDYITERGDGGKVVGMGADGTPTSAVDRVAEEVILDILYEKDMPLKVVSEEAGEVLIKEDYEMVLALDPLDGTFNAVKGIPFYSISMAYSNSDRFEDIFFGYVFDLCMENEFYTYNGSAFKNGESIKVSSKKNLKDADIIYYGGNDGLIERVKRTRLFGCASLELCLVAEGKMDAFFDCRKTLRPFDVGAGVAILESAGGTATDESGNRISGVISIKKKINVIASNTFLHSNIMRVINEG